VNVVYVVQKKTLILEYVIIVFSEELIVIMTSKKTIVFRALTIFLDKITKMNDKEFVQFVSGMRAWRRIVK